MSYSYTNTDTVSFTITHAKHMAAKVAADLKRMQRFYGSPSDAQIESYENEITLLLKKNYLGTVTYGFKINGNWIEPALRYTAHDLNGGQSNDDDPGRVSPNSNIEGASFYSFLTYSASYFAASTSEREEFERELPFTRGGASEPGVNGYLSSDKTYSSGGRALNRFSVKSY